MASGRGQEELA